MSRIAAILPTLACITALCAHEIPSEDLLGPLLQPDLHVTVVKPPYAPTSLHIPKEALLDLAKSLPLSYTLSSIPFPTQEVLATSLPSTHSAAFIHLSYRPSTAALSPHGDSLQAKLSTSDRAVVEKRPHAFHPTLYIPEGFYYLVTATKASPTQQSPLPSRESAHLSNRPSNSIEVTANAPTSKGPLLDDNHTPLPVWKDTQGTELSDSRQQVATQWMHDLGFIPIAILRQDKRLPVAHTPQQEQLPFFLLEDREVVLVALAPSISDSIFDFSRQPPLESPIIPPHLPKSSVPEFTIEPHALLTPALPPLAKTPPSKDPFFLSFSPEIERLSSSSLAAPSPHLKLPTIQGPLGPQLDVEVRQPLSLASVNRSFERNTCAPRLLHPPHTESSLSRPFSPITPLPTHHAPYYNWQEAAPLVVVIPSITTQRYFPSSHDFTYSTTPLAIAISPRALQHKAPFAWQSCLALDTPYISRTAQKDLTATPFHEDTSVELHKRDVMLFPHSSISRHSFALGKDILALHRIPSNAQPKPHLEKESTQDLLDPALAFETEGTSKGEQLPAHEGQEPLALASSLPEVHPSPTQSRKRSLETESTSPALVTQPPSSRSKRRAGRVNKRARQSDKALEGLPNFAQTETIPFYDEFEPEVFVAPRNDGEGYYFAVSLQPKSDALFTAPPQHIVFIADKSHSIKKHRFEVYRQGILKSLSYLKEDDRFNIITADAKMRELSSEPLPVTPETIRKAKEFLHKEYFSGYFDSYSPIAIFDKVYAMTQKAPSINVIWLTNGSGLKDISRNKNLLRSLKTRNRGAFTLYTATASKENNLAMLDLMSSVRQGELLHTQTHASFPRQLAILTKKISNTVATDIIMVARRTKARIELFTRGGQPLHFNRLSPYVIYGTTDSLEDFELFLQGTVGDQAIDIKQHVTFNGAKRATQKMLKAIAYEQAHLLYESYMREGKQVYLEEARARLAPFGIPTPFK